MARKLFGTDGIRGVAGEFPMDAKTAYAFGVALGGWAKQHDPNPEVVIGMDTRESGTWLARNVAGGLSEHGVITRFAGIITTPGIAYLTRTHHFVAGVMISASHNPYRDNGLKAFDHSGFKVPDDQELELEKVIFDTLESGRPAREVELAVDETLDETYVDFLASVADVPLAGMRIVLDCANGGASHLAPELFRRLGADVVHAIGVSPNGQNINLDCGALHVECLREDVLRHNADAGAAFDGDADRAILVSRSGKIIDGDSILLIAAMELADAGRLNEVIATVMSNLGLERALQAHGIGLVRTPVGDKYVLEEMIRRGVILGGEQSGHVIFRDNATTGDGMLTAVRTLEVVKKTGRDLDDLTADLKVYPQLLVNVRVKERKPLEQLPEVQREIRNAEETFGASGRVLVRFSGTEPLARVMVEGPTAEQVDLFANRIAGAIRNELGS